MLPSLDEIEKRRKNLGLNQKQLALLAGVSQSFIAKIESSNINPSYIKTKTIFDVLKGLEVKREMKASEIMHKKVTGIERLDPISKVTAIMRDTGFSQLPVFDGDNVVGSITEKTLLDEILKIGDPSRLSRMPVERVMEEAFPRVDASTPVSALSSLLQFTPAVLVTEKGRVGGIITKADLLRMING